MKEVNFIFEKKYYILFLILFLSYVLTAINSVGFYKDDEHFQILEPLAYLLGINTTLIDDPTGYYWEWTSGYRIRPWFQPFFYYQIISLVKQLNINDPFIWALVLRIFNGTLGLISVFILFFSLKKYFVKDERIQYYVIFFTFWFYPFLHVRTSSESLSITLFTITVPFFLNLFESKIIKFQIYKVVFFGFILGLAIVVRPQIIFTIFPFFLWFVFFKFHFYKLFITSLGILISISVGLYVDYLNWGYFTNTYWQIFQVQILSGQMQGFGHKPWWFYFITILKDLSPGFSLFFIIGLFIFSIKKINNIFTWMTLGTIIILLFFKHKETRFIFQIYVLSPFFVMYLLSIVSNNKLKNLIFYLSFISNVIFLLIICLLPANNKIHLYKNIFYENLTDSKIYYAGNNPYMINNLEPTFYTNFLPEIDEFNNSINLNKFYFVTNNYTELENIKKKYSCNIKFSSYPQKILEINKTLTKRNMNWYILSCEKT